MSDFERFSKHLEMKLSELRAEVAFSQATASSHSNEIFMFVKGEDGENICVGATSSYHSARDKMLTLKPELDFYILVGGTQMKLIKYKSDMDKLRIRQSDKEK
ncbi:hypothetical protein [Halalkalibacter krulwichiae]|uniref:Uncharacterized protein n=2 Tax=Halalkalibacter krulwichiae TaxID=199441 RepID=A0A1X9M7U3_9BACI|nr:hypothetical protein [Halalkalibacter krulwichiae]ARK28744.1 hypothetical protein BkAM31D_02155 [Halalkalibacter krulwichiae]